MHAGHCLAFDGATEEAIDWLERSKRLSPLDPLTFRIHTGMATAHLMARRPQEAYDWASRSQAENAHWIVTQRVLASACGHLGKIDEGRAAIVRLRELNPRATLAITASWFTARDKAALDFFLDGLRKAGLSE
jgi:predicted Zn-dependent protease